MSSDYDRAVNESLLWTPVLESQGVDQIELSTPEEDWTEAVDMVGRMPDGQVARFGVRSRTLYPGRPDYLREFTIRWKRPNGVLTEKDKMLEGKDWPDYMGYGFRSTDGLKPWVILRVAILRRLHKSVELDTAKEGDYQNHDGKRSTLRAFRLPELVRAEPDLVFKSSPNHPGIPGVQAPAPSRQPRLFL